MTTKREYDPIILEGKAYWAQVHEVDPTDDKYHLDIGHLTPESLKALKDIGLELKPHRAKKTGELDERGPYITTKANAPYPPNVVDSKKRHISKTTLIGNGSDVRVVVKPYDWVYPQTKKSGTSLGLRTVQVLKLVEYKSTGINKYVDILEDSDDGYITELQEADGYIVEELDEDDDIDKIGL